MYIDYEQTRIPVSPHDIRPCGAFSHYPPNLFGEDAAPFGRCFASGIAAGFSTRVVCLKLWVFMLTPEIANICKYAMFQDMAIQRIPSILMDFREIYFRDLPPKSCHAQCHKSPNPKTRLLRHLRLGGDFPTSTAVVEQNDAACFEKNAQ